MHVSVQCRWEFRTRHSRTRSCVALRFRAKQSSSATTRRSTSTKLRGTIPASSIQNDFSTMTVNSRDCFDASATSSLSESVSTYSRLLWARSIWQTETGFGFIGFLIPFAKPKPVRIKPCKLVTRRLLHDTKIIIYNNNNLDDIYSAAIYGASHMREFTVVHLGQSRPAPGGRQLAGQAANLTFESVYRLL